MSAQRNLWRSQAEQWRALPRYFRMEMEIQVHHAGSCSHEAATCKIATVLVYCMAGNVSSVGLGEPMVEQRLLQHVALASLLLGWMPIDGSAEPLGHGILDLGI